MQNIAKISTSVCKSKKSVRWITVGVSKWLVNSTVNYLDESASKITRYNENQSTVTGFLYEDSVVGVRIKW